MDRENPDPVLTSLHRATLAKLVTRDAVPGGRFIAPVTFTVAFTTLGGSLMIAPEHRPFWPDTVVSVIALVGALGFSVRDWVFLSAERSRIVRAFQRGIVPLRAYTDTSAHWSEGGFKPWHIGFGTSLGFGMFVLGTSQLLKISAEIPDWPAWTLALLGTGLTVFSLARGLGQIMRKDLVSEPDNGSIFVRPTWIHPLESTLSIREGEAVDRPDPASRA